MGAYLQLFWDLCRVRRGPADVPASTTLLVVLALLYWIGSAVQSRIAYGPGRFLGPATLDLALTLAFFAVVLAVTGRRQRYRQTVGAVLGASILLTPPLLLLLCVPDPAALPAGLDALLRVAMLALVVWYVVVVGSIMRSALDCGIAAGMALSVTYFLAGAALVESLFPPGA